MADRMKPTPETDALFMELPRGLGAALAKMLEHAQKLERERDALRTQPEATSALAPHYTRAEVRKLFDEWVQKNPVPLHEMSFMAYFEGFAKAQAIDVAAFAPSPPRAAT